MTARVIALENLSLAKQAILSIGSDKIGAELMAPKAVSRVLHVKDLRPIAANILKQEMLSFGGDVATAYGAINHSVRQSDVLVFGNLKQFSFLIKKLKMHQFGLPQVSSEIEQALKNHDASPAALKIGSKIFDFKRRTYVMGILNVTPDSFSDGGKFYDREEAIFQGKKMLEEGADIIDVGGESTRPGARSIGIKEEIDRVIPVIKALSKEKGSVISIDTRKAVVAQAALDAGARFVNDVSGLRFDKKMALLIAEYKAPVCLMHMRGNPKNMQKDPAYADLMGEIINYLGESIAIAKNAGILQGKIVVDPGIGFGKTVKHNLAILKRLRELKGLGCPILVGPSRKSVIGKVLNLPVEERLEGTVAMVALSIANGANLVRVHDVKEMVRVARMTDAIIKGE